MQIRRPVAILAVAAALSGCSGNGEEPVVAPPTAVRPTAPASSGPTDAAPPAPPGTPADPAEFARYYYEQIELGFARLDPATLQALSDPTCVVCTRYALSMQSLAERHERIEGYEITVRDAVVQDSGDVDATVRLTYVDTAARRVAEDGAVQGEEPGNDQVVVDLVLRRRGEAWLVNAIEAV